MYQRLLNARQARRHDDGFTLIELLIVIVILGILAGIVVFSVRGITDRGAVAACKSNAETAATAVEAYVAKSPTGAWPASDADLVPNFLHTAPPAGFVDYTGDDRPRTRRPLLIQLRREGRGQPRPSRSGRHRQRTRGDRRCTRTHTRSAAGSTGCWALCGGPVAPTCCSPSDRRRCCGSTAS